METQFNKAIVQLIHEIKKHAPNEFQNKIVLNNPALFPELLDMYYRTDNIILNALIRELFEQIGRSWSKLLVYKTLIQEAASRELDDIEGDEIPILTSTADLNDNQNQAFPSTEEIEQAEHQELELEDESDPMLTNKKSNSPPRMYRGQLIED